MNMEGYVSELKLKLTGGVLDLELDDATLASLVNSAFREIQRYIDETRLVTLPYERCIDLSKYNPNSVSAIYRAVGFIDDAAQQGVQIDPMYASQWQLLSGVGNLYNFQSSIYNFSSWNTLLQLRNTMSTDLAFWFDKQTNKLYINISTDSPENITVEYVPRYNNVEEIVTDYWIDMVVKLALALAKVTLGRVRSRFKQNNALWDQDGDQLLSEGNAELADLREKLVQNSNLMYPID